MTDDVATCLVWKQILYGVKLYCWCSKRYCVSLTVYLSVGVVGWLEGGVWRQFGREKLGEGGFQKIKVFLCLLPPLFTEVPCPPK